MPTPTIPGGHGLPPAPTIDSSTNCLIPFTPSAGTHIFRKLMFSQPEPFGTHFTSRPSQSGSKLPVDDRQAVADVRPGVLARDRVHGVRAQRVLERRARGAVAERLVDAAPDAAGSARRPARGRRRCRCPGRRGSSASSAIVDVAVDGLEDALARDARLAVAGGGERVAQVLRDVLQRPDVEVRGGVLDGLLEVGGDVDSHAFAFVAAALPARRPKTTHSSSELPIMRFRPCVPPAISPHA